LTTAPFTIRAVARIAAWLCFAGLAAIPEAPARDLSAMNSEEVTILQQRLTDAGCYTGAIDGRRLGDPPPALADNAIGELTEGAQHPVMQRPRQRECEVSHLRRPQNLRRRRGKSRFDFVGLTMGCWRPDASTAANMGLRCGCDRRKICNIQRAGVACDCHLSFEPLASFLRGCRTSKNRSPSREDRVFRPRSRFG
jgi:hypothetical protein